MSGDARGSVAEAAARGASGAFTAGVRLHDLGAGTVEERLDRAAELGFSCLQLPTKVLYASYGIGPEGLTRDFADYLQGQLESRGLRAAVVGCYKNLATPDEGEWARTLDEYRICLRFASWLGADVGTETGRPNAANTITDERVGEAALERVIANVAAVTQAAEETGSRLLIEPGWNEVVCTPERARKVLDAVASDALGVIYDPVSLLHPLVVDQAASITERMLTLCGERIHVLHAKDFEVVDNEDAAGWCDGSGARLVCHGAGETGSFDFSAIARWAISTRPGIPAIVENGTPETLAGCRAYLQQW